MYGYNVVFVGYTWQMCGYPSQTYGITKHADILKNKNPPFKFKGWIVKVLFFTSIMINILHVIIIFEDFDHSFKLFFAAFWNRREH